MSVSSFHLPLHELRFEFSRSGGAGGQNVNKVSTKVQIFWDIFASPVLSLEQKQMLVMKLGKHINLRGEVMVSASAQRSQMQNRQTALEKLQELIRRAFLVPKKRKPTKPTRASKEKRLEIKKLRSRVKLQRRLKEI